VRLDAELGRLHRVRSVWLNGRFDAQREMTRNERMIAGLTSEIVALRQAMIVRDAHAGPFALTVIHPNGTSAVYTERAAAGEAVRKAMRVWLAHDLTTTRNHSTTTIRSIGVYRGLTLEFQLHWFRGAPKEPELSVVLENDGQRRALAGVNVDTDTGVVASLDYHIRTLEEQVTARQRQQRELEQRQAELATSVARPWDGVATYQRVVRELERLNAELSGADAPASTDAADAEMDTLLAEALALTAAPAPDPIAPDIDAGSAVRAVPEGQAGDTQSVEVALSKAATLLPAPLLDTHPTPPAPQPAASEPEHPDPTPPPRNAAVTFGDHAWMRPPRRKPATTPVPAEQLRLFD
jgi:hypothetical protein